MEDYTFTDAVLQDYKTGMGAMSEQLPKLMKSFHKFTEVSFEEGEISQKYKQLIALAVSVYAHSEYCIIYHTKASMDAGSTVSEVLEAVGVAAALGGGSALSQAVTLVMQTIDEIQENPKPLQ
ncbi:carboxymuconolactone decarboxylase family protein [Sporosarcina sp. P21c]|uniref:carboxymuconolactone decarboxylase family protein n=1 Tax=Sporosarcina TaxID=1569 RepID=UPI000A16337E|nr:MULTISPECIES: carboxymuconolactone decarboxylase family protein [Sporosarcina]ARJ38492.1 alkylhydroperoxidase [Sporosarcina ureae]PIC66331.1 carboxymuconolactone decarboxylase family protein [Sporosarcina sp. P16a]PIC82621.1 carboxymuconolactone decarboxylase family protein [Sporosarcina sp. P1]PIC89214.1 carboxymuconolactone decarboxylase family protein [Sporosarcina sp. P21c]PIC92283.1 carboxymuconolactone decarboxylase family protein [Sporosarcina sp. P25]